MGEAFFWALEARLQAGGSRLNTALAPGHGIGTLPDGGAADDLEAAAGRAAQYWGAAALDDERDAAQDGAALSRADFEALVGQELRIFAYNKAHHALDFRIACSCASFMKHICAE